MAMCLMNSFANNKHFAISDIIKYFVEWLRSGPSDIGITTSNALSMLARKPTENYYDASFDLYKLNSNNAANGSLMRNGVIAAMMAENSINDVITSSVQHGIITHFASLPVLTCVIQSVLIYRALQSPDPLQLGPPTIQTIKSILENEWENWKNVAPPDCKNWLDLVKKINWRRKSTYRRTDRI